ncbi:helix-turn-helix transcriptional regulator [Prevotella sp. E15-22]|uniref:helix-turn-helix domain-containing protein n=1 Tax=Prevotella sp. E15-22 TaxID=2937774 RepID=UPI002062EE7A|nr:helix-turn-helix transcriptional regulator [Prevotella sp. E15-22]UPS43461.1 helix-turn-helix transcriptional regulator [Prevotella sp. E15-22]
MKTNAIMDEVRSTISPEMKLQMELSVAIANRIYDILEAKGMSQKDFARLMGKTETEVSRWLSGTHNLTMATICKISAALNAEVVKVAEKENPAPFMAVQTQALKEFREFKNMVAASDRPELTLDEINEEIRLAREERKARLLQSKSEYKQE